MSYHIFHALQLLLQFFQLRIVLSNRLLGDDDNELPGSSGTHLRGILSQIEPALTDQTVSWPGLLVLSCLGFAKRVHLKAFRSPSQPIPSPSPYALLINLKTNSFLFNFRRFWSSACSALCLSLSNRVSKLIGLPSSLQTLVLMYFCFSSSWMRSAWSFSLVASSSCYPLCQEMLTF